MASIDFGRHYFSRQPYRSFYFWLPTIWLLVVLGMALLMGKRFYDHQEVGGVGAGLWWICLSVAAPVVLWLRAWRSHSALYRISRDSRSSDQEYETRFGAVLTQAAYLEYAGLYVALLAVQSALIGFSKVVGK